MAASLAAKASNGLMTALCRQYPSTHRTCRPVHAWQASPGELLCSARVVPHRLSESHAVPYHAVHSSYPHRQRTRAMWSPWGPTWPPRRPLVVRGAWGPAVHRPTGPEAPLHSCWWVLLLGDLSRNFASTMHTCTRATACVFSCIVPPAKPSKIGG